jgi:hypothetical protein
MRKLIGGTVAAAALVVLVFSTARADDHLTPGQPGTPSCRGQTTAFLAQSAKNGHMADGLNAMGIGGVARASELSVSEVHAIIEAFCMSGPAQP